MNAIIGAIYIGTLFAFAAIIGSAVGALLT